MRLISFTLVMDNFGVKYVNKTDVDHLIASLQLTFTLTEDWTGDLYCGITLKCDYENRTVNISMSGYIKKKLQEYGHIFPNRIQRCPYSPEPKQSGSPKLDATGIKRVQKIVGSILYYARAVIMRVLMRLSSIAVEQTKATDQTLGQCMQLLDYLASNDITKVRFRASEMIMNIHSNTSYLLAPGV